MITGVMIYEDKDTNVLTETMNADSVMILDFAFREILDDTDGAVIQITYVDSTACTIINSEGFSA